LAPVGAAADAIDATRSHSQVATKAEAAEVSTTEKKGFLGGLDVPLLAYFFFWCAAAPHESLAPRHTLVTQVPRQLLLQHLEQDGP